MPGPNTADFWLFILNHSESDWSVSSRGIQHLCSGISHVFSPWSIKRLGEFNLIVGNENVLLESNLSNHSSRRNCLRMQSQACARDRGADDDEGTRVFWALCQNHSGALRRLQRAALWPPGRRQRMDGIPRCCADWHRPGLCPDREIINSFLLVRNGGWTLTPQLIVCLSYNITV